MTDESHYVRYREVDTDTVELIAKTMYSCLPGDHSAWSSIDEDTANQWRAVAKEVAQELYEQGLLKES